MIILRNRTSRYALIALVALVGAACSSTTPTPSDSDTELTECEQNNNCGESEGEGEALQVTIIKPAIPVGQREPLDFSSSYVYQSNSAFRSVLQDCFGATAETACDLATLPFIGQSPVSPSVESIMARTIVTHDWMGLRLSQFLAQLPDIALELFKPVTVIYVGSDINYISYDATQGKLSISPDTFWLTFGEKSTAFFSAESTGGDDGGSSEPANGRADLQFRSTWRMMKGTQWIFTKRNQNEREFEDVYDWFAYDIYASLAFAFDRMGAPSSSNTALTETPYDVFQRSTNPFVNQLLENPELTNTASGLVRYANIYYELNDATEFEKRATASYIGSLFALDGRMNFFDYYSPLNDFQDLFAGSMMRYKHGIHVDSVFLELGDSLCNSEIAYGIRNRVASPNVIPRARFTMESIFGQSMQLSEFFQTGIGVTEDLPIGTTWCDSAPNSFAEPNAFLAIDSVLAPNPLSTQ